LAPDVEKTQSVGKKYKSLLLSSSALHLFSISYGGNPLALITVLEAVKKMRQMNWRNRVSEEIPRENPEEIILLSGATVPVSGIWRPDHDDCADVAELWLRKDAFFPHCSCCGKAASFILIEEISHISEDPDFR
jgi:hypothetical protein